jgi:hypothetical protein
MSADMDTVETTGDSTMASIITLATCMHALSEGEQQQAECKSKYLSWGSPSSNA